MYAYNKIVLLEGISFLTDREYKNFTPGDAIFGINSNAKVLKKWDYSKKEKAYEELAKYKNEYHHNINTWDITEYALEFYEEDEEEEFISGSDYELAETL